MNDKEFLYTVAVFFDDKHNDTSKRLRQIADDLVPAKTYSLEEKTYFLEERKECIKAMPWVKHKAHGGTCKAIGSSTGHNCMRRAQWWYRPVGGNKFAGPFCWQHLNRAINAGPEDIARYEQWSKDHVK